MGVWWRQGATAGLVAGLLAGCTLFGGGEPSIDTALRARRLMVPVAGIGPDDVPDTFDAPRAGGRRRHHALDIPAPRGTPILAADDGVVLELRANRFGGLTIYATDPDRRFVYYYAHLDHYRAGLRRGATLAKGDVVGYVGTTGNADRAGPHLHFQVMVFPPGGEWWDGTPVDPRPYLASAGRVRD